MKNQVKRFVYGNRGTPERFLTVKTNEQIVMLTQKIGGQHEQHIALVRKEEVEALVKHLNEALGIMKGLA